MNKWLVALLVFGVATGARVYAQEQQKTVEDEAVALEWVMGIVKAVDVENKSIEVFYYDFENDKDATITVYVNKDTEYIGANSLKDISPGDDIEVSYIYRDDGSPVAEAVITAKFEEEETEEKKE